LVHSDSSINQVPTAQLQAGTTPAKWPAATPHSKPWPPPENWSQGSAFGCSVFDVRTNSKETGKNGFSMVVQQTGWPLPVIEQKQMWWDWNDPTLSGPKNDPAPTLMLRGLVLNPIILGGGAWVVLVLPWILAIAATRRWRHRRGRCVHCGYPVGVNAVCTECGTVLAPLPR